jgi:hypothetical protein
MSQCTSSKQLARPIRGCVCILAGLEINAILVYAQGQEPACVKMVITIKIYYYPCLVSQDQNKANVALRSRSDSVAVLLFTFAAGKGLSRTHALCVMCFQGLLINVAHPSP